MQRKRIAVILSAVVMASALLTAHAQQEAAAPAGADPAACVGLLAQPERMGSVLSAVPRYGSTYVLVVPQRLAAQVPTAAAPGLRNLEVGVHSGTVGAEVARALGITTIREYSGAPSEAARPIEDVRDGKLDAAIMWGPLAGLVLVELGVGEDVSVFSVDKPRPAPSAYRAQASSDLRCSMAIRDELDVSGVLPAELLVGVDFRNMLVQKTPALNLTEAREGGRLYSQSCSRCHGPDAIADPKGLAPVDLRISIRRFTYPAFHYIVLNGRPSKSMPPFRGTVTDDQIEMVYQYLKGRSLNLLPGQAVQVPGGQQPQGGRE